MHLVRRIAVTLLVMVVMAYGAGLLALFVLQRGFQYEPEGEVTELSGTTLTAAVPVTIATGEGSAVSGWYQAPQAGKPVILYLKGNAGSFTREHERYEAFAADGYGFLAFDYRGFPLSPGVISEANISDDALAAFDWLSAKGDPVVIWGRSLGSGPASYVASEREAQALYLETPFDSAVAVGQARYWFFPVGWLMQDQFRVDQWLPEVTEPTFVAVAGADATIPPAHGRRAYELAGNKGGFWEEPGAGHGGLWEAGEWAGHARPFFEGATP
jgi:pimeloyl-ACP methyl ester carboxylesterase